MRTSIQWRPRNFMWGIEINNQTSARTRSGVFLSARTRRWGNRRSAGTTDVYLPSTPAHTFSCPFFFLPFLAFSLTPALPSLLGVGIGAFTDSRHATSFACIALVRSGSEAARFFDSLKSVLK